MDPASNSGASVFQPLTSPHCWWENGVQGRHGPLQSGTQAHSQKNVREQEVPLWGARDHTSTFLPWVPMVEQLDSERSPQFFGSWFSVDREPLTPLMPLDAPAHESSYHISAELAGTLRAAIPLLLVYQASHSGSPEPLQHFPRQRSARELARSAASWQLVKLHGARIG